MSAQTTTRRERLVRGDDVLVRAAILDGVGEPVVATDRSGRIIYWNGAAETLFGYRPEEALGSKATDLLPTHGSRQDALVILRHVRSGGSWSGEIFLRSRSGQWLPVHAVVSPVVDRGRVLGIVGVARDLTAQRSTEEALRRTEQRLELVHRTTDSVIWEWDLETKVLRWNGAMADSFGYDPAEVDASVTWWEERLHPEDRRRVENTLTTALAQGRRFWTEEYRFRRADGTYAAIFDRAYVAVDDAGRPLRVVGTMLDLTERRRAHEAMNFLAQAGMLLDLSMEYETTLPRLAHLATQSVADACLLLVGTPHRVEFVTAAAAAPDRQAALDRVVARVATGRLRGTLTEALLLQGESVVLPDFSPDLLESTAADEELREAVGQLGLSGIVLAPMIARGQTVGAVLLGRAGTTPRAGDEDARVAEELGRRIGVAVDNARLYHSAELARRAKSDFLSVVSHELRTPLTAVMGYADLLDAQIAGTLNEKQRHQVDRIRAGGTKLLQVIEGILAYARLETGRETAQLERIPVARLLERVRGVIESQAAECGVRLVEDVSGAPEAVCLDVDKTAHVLMALLTNAVKFTPRGGVCGLRVAEEGGRLVFDVRDTGPGIAEDHLPHLFSPFWQAEQPEVRRTGGSGLGLSVARRLARVMDGDVLMLETSPAGTTFRVDLPLVRG